MSKWYKYIGGNVIALDLTKGLIYESYLDSDDDVHIVDDYWLNLNYDANRMVIENKLCYVDQDELNNCFVEVGVIGKLSDLQSFDKMYRELNFTDEQISEEEILFVNIHDLRAEVIEWEIWDTFDYWLAERYNWDIKNGKFK